MVTHLKSKDLPEPWHPSKKKAATTPGRKTTRSKASAVEDSNVDNVQGEPRKRGRPSTKLSPKVVGTPKGMKKTKALPASAVNIIVGVSQSFVPDVEELRRKRDQDAEACGRIVRTVAPHRKQKSTPDTLTKESSEEGCNNDLVAAGPSRARSSPPNSSSFVASREESIEVQEEATILSGNGEDEGKPISTCRPGKEPVPDFLEDAITPTERKHKRDHDTGGQVQRETDNDSQDTSRGQRGHQRRRGRSPGKKESRDFYEGRDIDLSESSDDGHRPYGKRFDESVSRSPGKSLTWSSRFPTRRNRGRSRSRSPVRRRGARVDRTGHDFKEYYNYASPYCFAEDYRKSSTFYSSGHGHRRQNEIASPNKYCRDWRSRLREYDRSLRQRSPTPYSSISPPRRSTKSTESMSTKEMHVVTVKEEDIAEPSAANDRKRRRRRQALVEAEKAKRQKNGNKPFYLTLDREGRPYGPGKPSWIAEINKLAIGLDPSCTHIRKQTFEDVQTFKDRLDDSFEYSGTLNEDYLRALMGKAVTKRRGELISMIKNNGTQPLHIDHEVWRRLQNLATSKQREERSEQGRHANACRTVVGRTGRRGVDGVREKLRSLFGRSPDPSEVEEEMHRDKSNAGRKRKKIVHNVEEEKNSVKFRVSDDDISSPGIGRNPSQMNSDAGYVEPYKRNARDVAERGQGDQNGVLELGVVAGVSGSGQRSFTLPETKKMTKDDYIEKLEAQIKLLEEEKAKASTSNTDMLSQSETSSRYRAAD